MQTKIDSCDVIRLSVNIFVYILIQPIEKYSTVGLGKWSITDNEVK